MGGEEEMYIQVRNLSFHRNLVSAESTTSCTPIRPLPSIFMKLVAGPIIAGAQRSAAAFALSGLLLLPTIGVVPPALADGDVRQIKSNHTARACSMRAARRRTLTPSVSVFADQRVPVSSHRPREKGPLQVRFVGDGSGQRSTRLPVRLARMCDDRLISRWVRLIWCSHGHRGFF